MGYYFSKILKGPFIDAFALAQNALKEEGFEILSDIDVQQALREKLNVTFKQYRILGACNPRFAHKALLTENKIGVEFFEYNDKEQNKTGMVGLY